MYSGTSLLQSPFGQANYRGVIISEVTLYTKATCTFGTPESVLMMKLHVGFMLRGSTITILK